MKYINIPIEIRNKIKERIEEEGNKYDEVYIANWYKTNDAIPCKGEGGFNYGNSTEGFTFWVNVINDRKHWLFFKKYLKESDSKQNDNDFEKNIAYPDEKVGTIYRQKSDGKLVSLRKNDGSYCPYFWNSDKSDYRCIDWHKLVRIDQPIVDRFSDNPRPSEVVGTQYVFCEEYDGYPRGSLEKVIGNQYKVVETTEPGYYQIGDTVIFERDDQSSAPVFRNIRTNQTVYIPWKNLVNNLNLNTHSNGKESSNIVELVLSRIPATISYGSAPRGTELSSTRGKVQLGS